jgi:hypothetical protein
MQFPSLLDLWLLCACRRWRSRHTISPGGASLSATRSRRMRAHLCAWRSGQIHTSVRAPTAPPDSLEAIRRMCVCELVRVHHSCHSCCCDSIMCDLVTNELACGNRQYNARLLSSPRHRSCCLRVALRGLKVTVRLPQLWRAAPAVWHKSCATSSHHRGNKQCQH